MADLLTRRKHDVTRRVRRPRESLTAAASLVVPSRALRLNRYPWQTQLWNWYRDGIGAFKYAMLWHSQTMSRVRLTAAVSEPGGDEPTPLTEGPAADAIAQFYGGPSGQSQYMGAMDLQLQIPGEGYVVGTEDPDDPNEKIWCVKSLQEMDVTTGKSKGGKTGDLWRMQVDEGVWETLPPDTHVFRQWIPDGEFSWRPDSPAHGAMRTLQIIDLLERRIMAQATSRLAMNGFMKIAQEITFPINPNFKDEPDPFMAELLDIAGKVMENPASPLAAMPLPIRIPAQYWDKAFEHVEFANPYDERLMELLQFFYELLATDMNMPKEVVTGMGSTSHWNAWSLDEQGIETHIKPPAEMMCQGLTRAYLHPWLRAVGEPTRTDKGDIIVWYDTSELDVPPDLSAAADAAYDRQAITREEYATAKGFSGQNLPTKKELREQLLLQLAKDPTNAPAAIEELTGSPVAGASTGPGGVDGGTPTSQPTPATGPGNRADQQQPSPPANPSQPPA